MTHLLKKDIRLVTKPWLLLIILVYGMFFGSLPEPDLLVFTGPLIVLLFAIRIVEYDNNNDSHEWLNSLPIRRKDVVNTKYAEGVIFTIVGCLAAFVLQFPVSLALGSGENAMFYPEMMIAAGAAFCILAVFYPLTFTLGMGYSIFFTLILFVPLTIVPHTSLVEQLEAPGGGGVVGIALLVCVLMYYVSYILSVRIFKRKDI